MLEKFLNKKVFIGFADYAVVPASRRMKQDPYERTGTVTAIDNEFIELDNNEIISMKCVGTIKLA